MTDDSSPATARPAQQDVAGELRLPKAPGVIRSFFARHPRFTDILVLLIYAVPQGISVLYEIFNRHDIVGALSALIAGLGVGALLLLRRRWPVVLAVVSITAAVVFVGRDNDSSVVAVCIAVYTSAVYVSVRAAWISFGIGSVAYTLAAIVMDPVSGISWYSIALPVIMFLLIAALIGINVGNRKRYIAALVDRAAQLVRERDQQAQLAAASERSRIAREMHDIVAHSLSVMVRLADGAEAVAASDPETALGAMRNIGATGRKSLAEMRRLLGVLRDEEGALAATAPQPTLDELGDLVQSYRFAGLPVRVQTSGIAPTAEGVQVAVYRAVQETLTNALRYARAPSDVLVSLDYSGRGVVLTVTDDGAGGQATESVGSGRGLIGMAERAALYGGTVESGRRPGGGWRVRMTMPEAGEDE
ncbi:histidine kinase [Okibacterium endophyticum]